MERLPPIPSPPGHLVREFCHRGLPIAVFVASLLVTIVLWNQRFTGTLLVGEVEPIRATAMTVEAGTLIHLHVNRFEPVTNGQRIATFEVLDPDAIRRSVDVLRSELEIMRSRMRLDEARNEQNVEAIRVRWLEARVELATARVSFENARRELARTRALFEEKVVSEAEYDLARSVHDALEAEVAERAQLEKGLSAAVARQEEVNRSQRGGMVETLNESLAAQERQLEAGREFTVVAPMSGIIRSLNHREGERVPANATICEITSPRSERIVGYVRQPIAIEPRPGMSVEIRTRGATRQIALSRILETHSVGADLEPVLSPLRLRGFDNALERGLAFYVAVPAGLPVRPGELVDLVVKSATD